MHNNPNPKSQIPNPIKKIFLIGMPAVGKTYWGTRLAQEYKLPFTDLDAFIAEQEKASIPELFALYGETGFREKENTYLEKIINGKEHTLIACGGGTPCHYDNIALMKENGIVIYLQADIDFLVNNIQKSNEIRPLFADRTDLKTYLQELLEIRKLFYEQAHIILQANDIALITFGEIISSCINKQ